MERDPFPKLLRDYVMTRQACFGTKSYILCYTQKILSPPNNTNIPVAL